MTPVQVAIEQGKLKLKKQKYFELGNLDAKRDWGHAKDYVEAMHLMLQQSASDDYVIATGAHRSVRELCEIAFKEVGINLEWKGVGIEEVGINKDNGQTVVAVDQRYFRPTEVDSLRGDISKTKKILGWEPKITFEELVQEMVQHDVKEAERERHLKDGGFRVNGMEDG